MPEKTPSLLEVFQARQDEGKKKKKKDRPRRASFVRAGHQVTVPAPDSGSEDGGGAGSGDAGGSVSEEDQVDVHAKNVHIDLEPHDHEDVYEDMDEAWPQDDLDLGNTKSWKPGMSHADQLKAKGQQKRQAANSKRRNDRSTAAGNLKHPQQQPLPGMDKVFSTKPPPKPGQWPEQHDDRMPLDQAKGKYLHVDQGSEVSPYWLQQTGHKYQTIPSRAMKGLKVDTNPTARWGSGTYKIGDDGSLELAQGNWDSSG